MPHLALLGATGAIGSSFANELRRQGTPYRVIGRSRPALEKSFGADPLAEISVWNPDEPATVRAACRGIDTLIYLVGVPYNQFRLHPLLMRKTLDAAIAEGVKRMLLIGTVYPYGVPVTPTVSESHPREPKTFKGRMRKEQEDLLLQAHAEGRIQGTILRLPDFYGPRVDKSFLDSLFQAAVNGGTANLLGPIDLPHEFVYVPDVGPVALGLAKKSEAWGHWWNLAGPAIITQREIADQVFALAGRPPKLRVVGRTMLRLLGLFNPLLREMDEMTYIRTQPVLLDDTRLHQLLGKVPKTSYTDGIRASFEAYRAASKQS